MIVIPAVDILKGRCVRLLQGRKEDETVYETDPSAAARRWAGYGIKRLHVVDLDGAFEKKDDQSSENVKAVEAIVKAVDVPIELGGGLRNRAAVERVFEIGVSYAIIGTVAVKNPAECRAVLEAFPGRVYVGIDASKGRVAVHGWNEVTDRPALDLAEEVASYGARGIIYTDISRDGMLTGPNLEALAEMSGQSSIPVIASGGIACLDDIKAVSKIPNIEGVITGKAIYDGRLDLKKALEFES